MTTREAKTLKWGDYIKPSNKHYKTFVTGKKIEKGIFLGLKKDGSGLLQVVTLNGSTVYSYHRHFWDLIPKAKSLEKK